MNLKQIEYILVEKIHPAVWLIQTAGKNAQINYAYTHAHCMLCMWDN